MKIYINTLGNFDILHHDESVLNDTNKAYRLLRLFQYFLTFKNKKILSETILEHLWSDSESYDPKNMLRAQIFRLRNLLKKIIPNEKDESQYITLNFNNGYYSMILGENIIVDTDKFEDLILQGDTYRQKDIHKCIEFYKEALSLYKGEYLVENSYEIWLVPIRKYYHRLYLKTLLNVVEILKNLDRHEEIVVICEEALKIEPFDEAIHISLMEGLLKLGQIKNALSHYNFVIDIFEKEKDLKPSIAMKDIYRKIQNEFEEKDTIDIMSIKKRLETEEKKGALLCDADNFRFIFNLQKRNNDREEMPQYIGLISLESKLNKEISKDEISIWNKAMTEILSNVLRKGDTFTFWNDMQILLMLFNVKDNGIRTIENRISEKIDQQRLRTKHHIQMEFLNLKKT